LRHEPAPQAQSRFAQFLNDQPGRAVFLFALLHILGLSFAILISQPIPGLDVMEQIAWARDPSWAYPKHPPLPSWIMAAALWADGHQAWIAQVMGFATSGSALLIVWALAIRVVDRRLALAAVLILEGVVFFNFAAVDYNHNVILLPLWAFVAYAAHRAFIEGKAADWALFGVAAGLGMLGKYATLFILAAVLGAFLADREGRAKLLGKGPWIALLCGSAIFIPHLLALYNVDFAPFTYANGRLKHAESFFDRVLFPLGWSGAQLLNAAPALCLTGYILAGTKEARAKLIQPLEITQPDLRRNFQFFGILFALPLLTGIVIQAVAGIRFHDMWGFPMFVLLGILVALYLAARPLARDPLPAFGVGALALLGIAMFAVVVTSIGSPYVMNKGSRFQFPARELAAQTGARWAALYPSTPLRYAVSDVWLGGMLTAYHPDRPSVIIAGSFTFSPWATPVRVKEAGAVIIWRNDREGASFLQTFPGAIQQPALELRYVTNANVPPARLGWAILPPAAAANGAAADGNAVGQAR
jgi:4-amino-4-deoxy-L-arabinose transferase-like glycosyltransferase